MVEILNENNIRSIFSINEDIKLEKKEYQYYNELIESVNEHIAEYGEEDEIRIKEIVHDTLLRDRKHNIIAYLGLEFEEEVKDSVDQIIQNESFKKIETTELNKDFFQSYLKDESLNDFFFEWMGYQRKAEGSKEIFIKVRGAITYKPTIVALHQLLSANFNKINFVSKKLDEEQALIINNVMKQAKQIILGTRYEVLNTQKAIEIYSVFGNKILNLIGYSDKNREDILSALSESYQSREDRSNKKQTRVDE